MPEETLRVPLVLKKCEQLKELLDALVDDQPLYEGLKELTRRKELAMHGIEIAEEIKQMIIEACLV